ncbi:glycerate kinase type-2 family protein [Paracoccus sp. T5]|uniref:glycerate kinase type-2 family protein n=1 Tax=Paracoccus sp. T5 TaxID=3402161 RepID=UPI003ADCE337
MRQHVMELLRAGIAAAAPGPAVARAMPDLLAQPLAAGGCWHVVAVGKAARAMAAAALEALQGEPVAEVLVVTNACNDAALAGARVLQAGHPEPDEAGLAAATEIERLLSRAAARDRVLALISGGASAMLPAPAAGLSLSDLQEVNARLLRCGADILQTNLIRQQLDRLKGGGWLRLSQAPVHALILSDVPGDDLRVIASGPTAGPIGGPADAARVARDLGIWDNLPLSVRTVLARDQAMPDTGPDRNRLIGSNGQSIAAMVAAGAVKAGLALQGDVQLCAEGLVALALDAAPGMPLAFGGETTVRLQGRGMGGRNQELALRFAVEAERRGLGSGWIFAAMGSDGRDGPGEAAGGIVGPDSLDLMRAQGIDPEDALARNDSTPALAAADALIVTGATGTNVADLAVFLRRA